MTRSPMLARLLAALFTTGAVVILSAACKKDPPPVPIDLTPATPVSQDAGVVQLVPLDDAGDAAPETGPAKPKGTWTPPNTNAARIRQCCNAIRHEAAKLGAAPEAAVMIAGAVQCDAVAAQVAGGSAPEFGQVRTLLKGHTLPAACSGM